MLKQVFLDSFELAVAHFGPPKIPKCLKNAQFWDQKLVKNGSKKHFFITHRRPFGVHKRLKRVHFEPILGQLGLSQVHKSLESGACGQGDHLQADSNLSASFNV